MTAALYSLFADGGYIECHEFSAIQLTVALYRLSLERAYTECHESRVVQPEQM